MTATAPNYDRTVVACFNGYVTQAIINNFMPLLFVTFSATLGIDMARLSMLISFYCWGAGRHRGDLHAVLRVGRLRSPCSWG